MSRSHKRIGTYQAQKRRQGSTEDASLGTLGVYSATVRLVRSVHPAIGGLVSVRFGIQCSLVRVGALDPKGTLLWLRDNAFVRLGAPIADEIKSQLFPRGSYP